MVLLQNDVNPNMSPLRVHTLLTVKSTMLLNWVTPIIHLQTFPCVNTARLDRSHLSHLDNQPSHFRMSLTAIA